MSPHANGVEESLQVVAAVDDQWLGEARARLLEWYTENHRRLPWRETRDPYRIWVSEIMLQQTQVATVLDYYRRFLEAFPTVVALAEAEEQEVLRLWAGLGYYRRARQLHAAAKLICERYQGRFPDTQEKIADLPGVGRYTAGAIASFAFDLPAPILEANTARLFSRLILSKLELKSAPAQKQLWSFAEQLVTIPEWSSGKGTSRHTPTPGRVNQAAMELGSQVCIPKMPRCEACPLQSQCPTYRHGLQLQIPRIAQKPAAIKEDHVLVLLPWKGRYLMRQNQPGQWWEGLWDFPRTKTCSQLPVAKSGPVTAGASKPNSSRNQVSPRAQAMITSELQQHLDLDCELGEWLYTLKHAVTKYRICVYCMTASLTASKCKQVGNQTGWRWLSIDEMLEQVPLTSTAKKLANWLAKD
ncbi:MAG: A/G-specific adenine glycosylase [bacterium]|nr:A/G-specific adenine glycosylase [bacterium]